MQIRTHSQQIILSFRISINMLVGKIHPNILTYQIRNCHLKLNNTKSHYSKFSNTMMIKRKYITKMVQITQPLLIILIIYQGYSQLLIKTIINHSITPHYLVIHSCLRIHSTNPKYITNLK